MIEAGPAYVAALAAIHQGVFPPEDAWSAHAFAELLAVPGVYGLIDDGGLILMRLAADEAEILTLAILPAQRRRGVARRLLAAGLRRAWDEGARRVFLEVSAGNAPAQALYAAEGFKSCGRRVGYYSDGSDALVLQISLCGSE